MSQVPNTSPSDANFEVANSTGANVRGDLNNILDAILTMNSGSSGPSYAKAYTLWADTTAGTMKIRNAANDAWIELFQLDGTLTLEDGSASTPALAFRDDLNTGIFSSAADTFNVATGGVERMELKSTETVFNEDGSNTDFRIEGDTEANLFFLDAGNERIGIGTNSPSTLLHISDSQSSGGVGFTLHNSDSSASTTPYCFISAILNPSRNGGEIRFGREGTYGDQNSADSFMAFYTSANDTNTERMRIDSSGRVGIGTTSPTAALSIKGTDTSTGSGGTAALELRQGDANNEFVNLGFQTGSGGPLAVISAIADATGVYPNTTGQLTFNTQVGGGVFERMRIDSSGRLLLGTGAVSLPKGSGAGSFDLDNGNITMCIGGDSNSTGRTNSATKTNRITSPHYTNAEQPVALLSSFNESGNNTIFYGGGSSQTNAVTVHSFYTAGDTTTTTGLERMRIDSSGRLLLGASSSRNVGGSSTNSKLQIEGASQNASSISLTSHENDPKGAFVFFGKTRGGSGGSATIVQNGDTLGGLSFIGADGNDTNNRTAEITAIVNGTPANNTIPTDLVFSTSTANASQLTEAMRITSDNAVQIAAGGAIGGFASSHVVNSVAPLKIYKSSGSTHAGLQLIWDHFNTTTGISQRIQFTIGDDASSDGFNNAGFIGIEKVDSWQSGAGRHSALVFGTTNAATEAERMRLDSNGRLLIGETTTADVNANLTVAVGGASLAGIVTHSGTTANRHALACCNDNGHIGGITTSGSTTSFNTSSDYRLKENITTITDGITRLKTLIPRRFNFKTEKDKTVDGFIAHEVTAVPESVSGTKDEVATEDSKEVKKGDPIYQQIDQAKLVPLLTAALQEAVAKLEVLETKVAALEAA